MSFHTFIKAVGTGPKSNRELTVEEVKDCVRQILNQEPRSELIVAFLLGWRVRLETNSELKAAFEVCSSLVKKTDIPNSIELGFPYDGKTDAPYVFPLLGKYLKEFDLNVVVSGDFIQPAKRGVTIKDICTSIDLDSSVHFFDRKEFLKELSDLTDIRSILRLRSAFNTIEKLLNPANSKYAVTSAYHKPYVEKYSELFASNYENFVVIKGDEGRPEIIGKTKCWVKGDGGLDEFIIDPSYYGVNYSKVFEKITLDEMKNELNNPCKDLEGLAKLNAALMLYAANKAKDFDTAYSMIR